MKRMHEANRDNIISKKKKTILTTLADELYAKFRVPEEIIQKIREELYMICIKENTVKLEELGIKITTEYHKCGS